MESPRVNEGSRFELRDMNDPHVLLIRVRETTIGMRQAELPLTVDVADEE